MAGNLRYLHTPEFYFAWTANVRPRHITWPGMKLKILIKRILGPLKDQPKTIRQFGQARLVKRTNGQHELVGGSDADRAAAFEWVSLFAHEIVFTHFFREARPAAGRVVLRPPCLRASGLQFQNPVSV